MLCAPWNAAGIDGIVAGYRRENRAGLQRRFQSDSEGLADSGSLPVAPPSHYHIIIVIRRLQVITRISMPTN